MAKAISKDAFAEILARKAFCSPRRFPILVDVQNGGLGSNSKRPTGQTLQRSAQKAPGKLLKLKQVVPIE